jgi:hypothetical protein
MSFAQPPVHRDVFLELPDGRYTVDEQWLDFFRSLVDALNSGATATVPLAKITGGGSDGSLTIINGLITSVTAPT